tara:strand:- start:139 stop:666 length:528 start_codon:yes stop_codon:yes gene_type:complete
VCVFCGSRAGKTSEFSNTAKKLGELIAKYRWRLVYGGGDVGLMGDLAKSVQKNNGDILGVIPTHLLEMEVAKTDVTSFIVTENMHERKKVMFMNSDTIIILPGGIGTLDEFFEVLTWRQLNLHNKKIYVLNINGFWNKLIGLLDELVSQEFVEGSVRDYFTVITTIDEIDLLLKN